MDFVHVGKGKKDFQVISPYKDTIERQMYGRAKMVSHVQSVTGPDIERHVRNLRNKVATTEIATIEIIDCDWHVHAYHNEWLNGGNDNIIGNPSWQARVPGEDGCWYKEGPILHLKHNVSLIEGNIEDISIPERFIDADLMGNCLNGTGRAVKKILRKQATFFTIEKTKDKKKALIFTFSMRPAGEKSTLNWIEDLIYHELDSDVVIGKKIIMTAAPNATIRTNGFRGVGVSSYDLKNKSGGRLIDMCLYYYNETGSPMITGMVVYK